MDVSQPNYDAFVADFKEHLPKVPKLMSFLTHSLLFL